MTDSTIHSACARGDIDTVRGLIAVDPGQDSLQFQFVGFVVHQRGQRLAQLFTHVVPFRLSRLSRFTSCHSSHGALLAPHLLPDLLVDRLTSAKYSRPHCAHRAIHDIGYVLVTETIKFA